MFYFSKILNFLYKKHCLLCKSKKENTFLCSECKKEIVFNSKKLLKEIDGIKIYSACNYSGNPLDLIRLLKFHNKKELAVEIAKISFDFLQSLDIDFSEFEIVPVPINKKKKRERGFNQCELISFELSKLMNIPFNFNLIKKIRYTEPMYRLNYEQRLINLKDAFEVNKNEFNNKKILLIDDIVTTGSTLSEIIKELKKNNINDIICFTFTNTDKNAITIK